jgi:hypothetical protein
MRVAKNCDEFPSNDLHNIAYNQIKTNEIKTNASAKARSERLMIKMKT